MNSRKESPAGENKNLKCVIRLYRRINRTHTLVCNYYIIIEISTQSVLILCNLYRFPTQNVEFLTHYFYSFENAVSKKKKNLLFTLCCSLTCNLQFLINITCSVEFVRKSYLNLLSTRQESGYCLLYTSRCV